MKQLAFVVIILLIPLSVGPVRAQASEPTPTPAVQNSDIMGEDDRLPFMQNQPNRVVEETSSTGLFLKTLGAMFVIVGLIFGGAWLARKLGFSNMPAGEQDPEHALAVIRTVALGTGRSVSTVRFGDRVLLVGSTPQNINVLAEVPVESDNVNHVRRSVAEMLVEHDSGFAAELELAEERMTKGQGDAA